VGAEPTEWPSVAGPRGSLNQVKGSQKASQSSQGRDYARFLGKYSYFGMRLSVEDARRSCHHQAEVLA